MPDAVWDVVADLVVDGVLDEVLDEVDAILDGVALVEFMTLPRWVIVMVLSCAMSTE